MSRFVRPPMVPGKRTVTWYDFHTSEQYEAAGRLPVDLVISDGQLAAIAKWCAFKGRALPADLAAEKARRSP